MSELKNKDDQIKYLWSLLDDISTAGDMFRPEINGYFKYVNKKCEERSAVANSFDGHTLTIIDPDDNQEPKYPTGNPQKGQG